MPMGARKAEYWNTPPGGTETHPDELACATCTQKTKDATFRCEERNYIASKPVVTLSQYGIKSKASKLAGSN
jgi:hypothetical protein